MATALTYSHLFSKAMEIQQTALSDVWIFQPLCYADERGYFCELFHEEKWRRVTGSSFSCVQINQSLSKQHVLRGLHFQAPPHAQSKLVQVLVGEILDIAVDLRQASPTYGQHICVRMSSEKRQSIFIPKGFAHGFLVLSKEAIVQYGIDAPYVRAAERGIRYDDPELGIQWPGFATNFVLSKKDRALDSFSAAKGIF